MCVGPSPIPGQASLKRKLEKKEKEAIKKRKQELGQDIEDENQEEAEGNEEDDGDEYVDADWEPEEAADDEQEALQPAKRRR